VAYHPGLQQHARPAARRARYRPRGAGGDGGALPRSARRHAQAARVGGDGVLLAGGGGRDRTRHRRVRGGGGAGVLRFRGAGDRRVGAGDDRPALGAAQAVVERAERRGARLLPPHPRAGQRGPGHHRALPGPAGAGTHPVQRRLQVRRHRRDDVAVPDRAAAAAGEAGRRVPAAPPLHHRPGKGRPPPARARRGDRLPPHPAERGRALLRALRRGPAPGGHGGDRRARAAGGGQGDGGALRDGRPARQPGRPLRGPAVPGADGGRRAHPRDDAVLRPPARRGGLVPAALGGEPGEAAHARRRRGVRGAHPRQVAGGHRPALAGAALRGGAVRQDDHLPGRGRAGDRRGDPQRVPRAGRAGVPGRADAGRAAAHGDAGHRGGAGAARADEHDDRAAAGGRALAGRGVHAAADRHRVRRPPVRGGPARPAGGRAWQAAHLRNHGPRRLRDAARRVGRPRAQARRLDRAL
ncbi:MAG: Glucose-6-phosphate isomerase, partial [uncultured Gemmatimonadetes bacterium]